MFLELFLAVQVLVIIITFLLYLNFSDRVSVLGLENMVNLITVLIEFLD